MKVLRSGPALHRDVAQLVCAVAELRRLLGIDGRERRVHLALVGRERLAHAREQRLGLLVRGLADLVETLLILLELGVDDITRGEAIVVTRIERTAEFSAVQRDDVLVGARGEQGPLGRGRHHVGLFAEIAEGGDANPGDRGTDPAQQEDDPEDLAQDAEAAEKMHDWNPLWTLPLKRLNSHELRPKPFRFP
ncbi:hypothetical protein ACVWZ3_001170 [Bradyrhizobium sp. i1.3.6]